MFVYLNPGHDLFHDPGAVNERLRLTEAEMARELAWLVSDRLKVNCTPCQVHFLKTSPQILDNSLLLNPSK